MKKCFERAALLSPEDSQALIGLGDFYWRQGRTADAAESYKHGVERWAERSSDHTRHALRIYNARVVVSNDVIPEGLLFYCAPSFDVPAVCMRLSGYYQHAGNDELASHFKAIGKWFSKDRQ